jgi:predicted nucleic acid-binding protein
MNVNPDELYFVDTNILIYAYDRSAGQKRALAVELLDNLWEHENGCLSLQVLQEFFVTVTRKIPSPLDHPTARQIVLDLSHWRLHIPEARHLLAAIDLLQEHQLSFWDGMIVESAQALGCPLLISEDFTHGQKLGNVQVLNPFVDIS